MTDVTSLVAVIGAFFGGTGTLIGIFMKYISARDKAQEKRDDVFTSALQKNTDAMKSVASATKNAAQEAKERNGHLAEIAAENQKANVESSKQILNAVKEIKTLNTQKVEKQVVEKLELKEVKG